MAAKFMANRSPCRKKSILAKVVFAAKRVSMWIRENEYIFKATAICTSFGAICCKMECVLVLNARRFDAKCKAFWC